MLLEVTPEQVTELATLLEGSLQEMSHEIADTENARYRARLLERRRILQELAGVVFAAADEIGSGSAELREV